MKLSLKESRNITDKKVWLFLLWLSLLSLATLIFAVFNHLCWMFVGSVPLYCSWSVWNVLALVSSESIFLLVLGISIFISLVASYRLFKEPS